MAVIDTDDITFTGEVHPAAEAWPMLPQEELDELAASIANIGLVEPITIDNEGRLLDGRNRLAACQKACVDPVFVVHLGDPIAFIIAKNNDRRHMTTGARAMATAKVLAGAGRRKNGRWQRGAIATSGSGSSDWDKRMAEAGSVIDYVPLEVDKVIAGDVALDAAYRKARQVKEASESYDAQLAKLTEEAPDLAANVTDDRTLAEALAALNARREDERKQFESHVKFAQTAASGWAFLVRLADRQVERQADVLGAVNPTDRKLLTDAMRIIRKGRD